MGLLGLKPADRKIADLLKAESEGDFPDDKFPDIKGLWFGASLEMREVLKQSSWKDFLPEISENQVPETEEHCHLDPILKTIKNLLGQFMEGVKSIEPFAGIREQREKTHVAPITIGQLEQEESSEEDPRKFWQFWDRMEAAVARTIEEFFDEKPGVEPESEQGSGLAPTPEFKPESEPEIGTESEKNGTEFSDAYSALMAAEKIVGNIHLRLLTRGEGKQEIGTMKLIAQALRVIGCLREMGANEDADKIEQKLDRILVKF